MLDHFSKIFPLAILTASLMGSSHCAAMCGAFQILVGSEKMNRRLYHAGRLLSYLALGAIAGRLGQAIFYDVNYQLFSKILSILFVLWFFWMAIKLYRKENIHPPFMNFFTKISQIVYTKLGLQLGEKNRMKAFLFGSLSVLLPCGWLFSFVLAAAATQSIFAGIATMALFWLGTLPAFFLLHKATKFFPKKFSPLHMQRISSVLLILSCIFVVAWKSHAFFQQNAQPNTCEFHQK